MIVSISRQLKKTFYCHTNNQKLKSFNHWFSTPNYFLTNIQIFLWYPCQKNNFGKAFFSIGFSTKLFLIANVVHIFHYICYNIFYLHDTFFFLQSWTFSGVLQFPGDFQGGKKIPGVAAFLLRQSARGAVEKYSRQLNTSYELNTTSLPGKILPKPLSKIAEQIPHTPTQRSGIM